MKKVILTALTVVALLSACKKKEESVSPTNQAPEVSISADDRYSRLSSSGVTYSYFATATDANGSISKVVFYANNIAYDTIVTSSGSNKYYNEAGYTIPTDGTYKFYVVAYDNAGASTKSNEITETYTSVKLEVGVK